jgi:hypothetical protein
VLAESSSWRQAAQHSAQLCRRQQVQLQTQTLVRCHILYPVLTPYASCRCPAHAGAVGLIIIVVVERGLKLTDLAALGMALSNTFGLSVGILLMGYGLVEIPRGLWKSDPQQLLKWSAHRCGVWCRSVPGGRAGHRSQVQSPRGPSSLT